MAGAAKPRRVRQAIDVLRVRRLTVEDRAKLDEKASRGRGNGGIVNLGFGWKGYKQDGLVIRDHPEQTYAAEKPGHSRTFDPQGTVRIDLNRRGQQRYDANGKKLGKRK